MMNKAVYLFVAVAGWALAGYAGTIYVSPSGSALNDGSSWTQSVSDLAVAGQLAVSGDTILVSNGVYTSEGVAGDEEQNVICVNTGITLRSVNGYAVTTIDGGGSNRCVYMSGSNTVLDGFTITGGRAHRGGGVMGMDKASVANCYFYGNTTTNGSGGGAYMYSGRLENSRFESNVSFYAGGGICMWNKDSATGLIYNSSFRWNQAGTGGGSGGGGVFARRTVIDRCVVADNEALASDGGGVILYYDTGRLRNSLVVSNEAHRYGGGVYLAYQARMENTTVTWNKSPLAAGLYCYLQTNFCINSIIYNNTNTQGSSSNYGANASTGDLSFTNCCTAPLPNGLGNISSDPLLGNGGFSLPANSPCVNAGLNMDWMPGAEDLNGNPRLVGGTVDIGAVEYQLPTRIYVDAARTDDSGDGTSWATAKRTIQAGVDSVGSGGTVWVTNGVYNIGGKAGPGDALTNRVCITKSIVVQSVNGPAVTTIAGAAGSNGSNDADSVRGVYMTNACVLSGFTVTDGYTTENGLNMDVMGGGLIAYTNCLVSNCVFSGNSAVNCGGAAYMYYGGRMTHCEINNNHSRGNSGGVHAGRLSFCIINSNQAYRSGGVESAVLDNCVVRGNAAQDLGGGSCSCLLNNCLVVDNTSGDGAGAGSYSTFYNSTICGNSAVGTGGGVHNGAAYNSIVWGNTASQGPNLYNAGATNVCAENGVTSGVAGCITNDPLFMTNGTYKLQAESPCINAGSNLFAPTNSSPYDLAGVERVMFDVVDMGAYEVQFMVSSNSGPTTGGGILTLTNGVLGSGIDITNVMVGAVSVETISEQGANWVTFLVPTNTVGWKDITVQSDSMGSKTFIEAYLYEVPELKAALSGPFILLLFDDE